MSTTDSRAFTASGVNHSGIDLDGLEAEAIAAGVEDVFTVPTVGSWTIGENGVLGKKVRKLDGNEVKQVWVPVTSTPPVVTANLIDVNTGNERALVAFEKRGRRRELAVDRDVLFSNTRIVSALAPLGANVSTTNARDVVEYLTECDRAFGDAVNELRSTASMGWAKGERLLVPYGTNNVDATLRFYPTPDAAGLARRFLEPAGTLLSWVSGVSDVRRSSVVFRAMMSASLASVLVRLVGAQPFALYLWGRSRSGKTAALKAAASVWADPTEGADAYVGTFADTKKSIVRKAAMLGDFPVIIDELQSCGAIGQAAKRADVESLIYELTLGHERSALRADRSMMGSGSWSSVTIATGEVPLTGDTTQQGALNRVVELRAEPFSDPNRAQDMHWLVAENYGIAGREFASYLAACDKRCLRDAYRTMVKAVEHACPSCLQAQPLALLALADALSECRLFGDETTTWESAYSGALAFAQELAKLLPNRDERDTDRRAIELVSQLLVANKAHFDGQMHSLERYGWIEHTGGGVVWVVLGQWFRKQLEEAGFDERKTLQRMRDEGIIQTSGRSLKMSRRVDGARVRCVIVYGERLNEFIGE